jgi:hypothetical protein
LSYSLITLHHLYTVNLHLSVASASSPGISLSLLESCALIFSFHICCRIRSRGWISKLCNRFGEILIMNIDRFIKVKVHNNIILYCFNTCLLFARFIPYLKGVLVGLDLNDDPVHLVFLSKLVANECETQILPVLIRVCLGQFHRPLPSIFAVLIFPHGFDTLCELNKFINSL